MPDLRPLLVVVEGARVQARHGYQLPVAPPPPEYPPENPPPHEDPEALVRTAPAIKITINHTLKPVITSKPPITIRNVRYPGTNSAETINATPITKHRFANQIGMG